ncbi:MAG: ribonuclease HII [Clostridia bacterium]|nr:MAG: ribonuclease HII [Clostridia bacterium]
MALSYDLEEALWRRGMRLVAGVDEVGRGPLAGPVVAAAVVFAGPVFLPGLNDSKRVSPGRRVWLAGEIKARALGWAVAAASHREIDRLNILQATYLAMRRALRRLQLQVEYVLVDGFAIHGLGVPQEGVVGGDALSPSIAAASVLAKVTRDHLMERLDRFYPVYGFARNKGYPTPGHLEALARYGPCRLHRCSFAPVRAVIGL